jgi:hypothetical protein
MPEESKLEAAQGLRLMRAFYKLRSVHDRQQIIALAERLLADQNEPSQMKKPPPTR